MQERILVYSKQTGEGPIPMTVRLNWLPDGSIKPLFFWAPDGAKYKVICNYECVSLAFLKEGGEGLRFRVMTELMEMPEPYSGSLHSQQENYLYLAHSRFCEKNIIDSRYEHRGKEYIAVTMDVFPEGDYQLVYFCFRGERYIVERTVNLEPRGSFHAGGIGLCHKVEGFLPVAQSSKKAVKYRAALYLELNKWFLSVPDEP